MRPLKAIEADIVKCRRWLSRSEGWKNVDGESMLRTWLADLEEIVRLREALSQAWPLLNEFREAFSSGALRCNDGRTNQRANRTVDVEVAVRQALGDEVVDRLSRERTPGDRGDGMSPIDFGDDVSMRPGIEPPSSEQSLDVKEKR